MGPVISVFVLVLVVAILAGLTFLFVAQLKVNTLDSAPRETYSVVNETGFINESGYTLTKNNLLGFANPVITIAWNGTGTTGTKINAGNYTVSATGVVTNSTASPVIWADADITYTYTAISNPTAYEAVNDTEAAGSGIVGYLPLIFLALIFGAILTLVLKIILPYINLGQSLGSSF